MFITHDKYFESVDEILDRYLDEPIADTPEISPDSIKISSDDSAEMKALFQRRHFKTLSLPLSDEDSSNVVDRINDYSMAKSEPNIEIV